MIRMLSDFHFERPWWLLLLVPAVALWLLGRRSSDPAAKWRRIIAPELLTHLLAGRERRSWMVPNDWLLVVWVLGAVAIAGPAWERQPTPFADAPPPVVVVLKVTKSMNETDLAPTRLDRARQKLADLLSARGAAETGLVAYAGSAHTVLPPTADADVVLAMAKAVSPDIMPKDGDDLGAAIALADRLLAGNPRGGSILLMADTAAGEALGRLASAEARPAHEVIILALVPPDQGVGALEDVARTLNARLIPTTIDSSDVTEMAQRLESSSTADDVAGEGERWKDEGYWLTPLLALAAVVWFRRGWVLT
jgi:Ca-activated chloride channel homolog